MTLRQKILKTIYPLWMIFNRLSGKRTSMHTSNQPVKAPESFYNLEILLNDGSLFKFADLKGKKVFLVNTASDCGYTPQYTALQQLHETFKGRLVVMGFPSNDFKEQEKADDKTIAEFCRLNYGVDFMLAKKSSVRKGKNQHPVFRWLSNKEKNGWNDQEPAWNFSKYLVGENGELLQYFEPGISPLDAAIVNQINAK